MRVQALKSGDDNDDGHANRDGKNREGCWRDQHPPLGPQSVHAWPGSLHASGVRASAWRAREQERRGYREMRRLQETGETMTRMADSLLPDALALAQELPTMLARLEAANRMCNRILQHQDEPREHEALGKGRERRRAELDASVRRMREHCAGTDARHDREMAETRARYERLAVELQEGYARTTAP
ncbi:biogenesis of lysosome-related organelles complex 1 subunit 5 isoform X2 [Lampetra fluviatilis]